MIVECSRCGFEVDCSEPPNIVTARKERHEGRHQHKKIQDERYPTTKPREYHPLGGLDYGPVEWIIHK